jgi:Nucleotide hydrolase
VQMPERSSYDYVSLLRCSLNHYAMPEVLAVPKNMKLLAIPLFELYDNAARYVHNDIIS